MKKFTTLFLAVVLLLSLASACSNTTATSTTEQTTAQTSTDQTSGGTTAELDMSEIPSEQFVIAVGINSADEASELQKKYLSEEIGSALNIEFIFSEELADAEALLTFMENAYSSGADAVISTITNAHEAGATKAEELGLYFTTISSTYYPSVETLSHNLGVIGISAALQAEVFKSVATSVLDDGNEHNVIIVSGGAGMGVKSHFESTKGLLSMLQEKFSLTYDKSIDDLASSTAVSEIATGTDMKITVYPGFGGPTYVSDFSSLLQTGDYDIVLETYAAFQTFAVAIDEVEKAFEMDIKQIAVTSVNDATRTAFESQDSLGNSVLSAAIINPGNVQVGMAVGMLYNALIGQKDAICPDGTSIQLNVLPWAVNGPEDYAKLSMLDTSHETYALNSDDLKMVLYNYNPNTSFELMQETLNSLTAQALIEMKIN